MTCGCRWMKGNILDDGSNVTTLIPMLPLFVTTVTIVIIFVTTLLPMLQL